MFFKLLSGFRTKLENWWAGEENRVIAHMGPVSGSMEVTINGVTVSIPVKFVPEEDN